MVDLQRDLLPDINNKTALLVVAGVILGLTVGFLAAQNQQISKQKASQKLVSTLEAQSGEQLEVVTVSSESGVYRIEVADQQNRLSTYHITKNGRFASSEMSDLDQLRQTIELQQQFVGCLSNKSAVLYGNSSQQTTKVQIQVLGGPKIASPVYKDVSSEEVVQEAAQRGVKRVPSFYHNGSVISGVSEISRLSELTGCSFGPT